MITKIKIHGYRIFKDLTLEPHLRMNLIAGANESGKSTLMEAIALALTGRIHGRAAGEELNPYWFNLQMVSQFIQERRAGKRSPWPEIRIEFFLKDNDELQQLCGAINSDVPTNACPGVCFRVLANPDYNRELEEWLKEGTPLLPVEYYAVDWRSFADATITVRPKQLMTAVIDSRTVRSSTGVDYHTRRILSDGLQPAERAEISIAYRRIKFELSETALSGVNERMAQTQTALHDEPIVLAMDQSSRTSWEGVVIPHVNDVPFSMSGQGQQAAIKLCLAMSRHSEQASFVMIEEPENHLTHTSLNTLLSRIGSLAGEKQQLFVATHSSFVVNRLGLDGLLLLGEAEARRLSELTPETVAYFQKLPGHDTLRMALANKIVLVEGPSDEIIFERIFRDLYEKRPIEMGIDVLSMRGLSLRRCLELCAALDKTVASVRDNDGQEPGDLGEPLQEFLAKGRRELFIGAVAEGSSLEPQLLHFNGESNLRSILGISDHADVGTWMRREKTEAALRIAITQQRITPPLYMRNAAVFIHG